MEAVSKSARFARLAVCRAVCLITIFSFSAIACQKSPAPASEQSGTPTAGLSNPAASSATPSAVTSNTPSPSPTGALKFTPIEFTDVTQAAGIRFQHNNGAFGKKYLPETNGSGGAFIDYDQDGWQDIILINSMDFDGAPKRRRSVPALYHNNRDG